MSELSKNKKAKERLLLKKKKDKQKKIFFGVVGGLITILIIGLIFFVKPDEGSSIVDAGKAPEQAVVDMMLDLFGVNILATTGDEHVLLASGYL